MEILELFNPWWKEKKVSAELAFPYRRKVFPELTKLFGMRQITVITGLRRVGKSTLMYQLIEDMIKERINPESIVYFSFDEKSETPLDILSKYSELTGTDWKKERCFAFFDEIQKLPDWSSKIKIIYDRFPNLKLVISGSGSFQLEKDAKSNLAGRHFVSEVSPLSFEEYLELKGSSIELQKAGMWKEEIEKEFRNYLFRPFPETVRIEDLGLVKSYIRDNVIEKVLKVDLMKKFKGVNEDLLTSLIDIFYGKPGMYLNYDDISKDLKISKKTLLRHIYYMEFARILRRVKNYRPSAKIVSRKMQRAYPFHWSLLFGWKGKIDFETVAASLLDAKYYWRDKEKEVDFLIIRERILPLEVKEGEKVEKSELEPLLYFMKKFSIKEGIVAYNGKGEKAVLDGLQIEKIPFWKLSLSGRIHED